jgi:hypothetical protein
MRARRLPDGGVYGCVALRFDSAFARSTIWAVSASAAKVVTVSGPPAGASWLSLGEYRLPVRAQQLRNAMGNVYAAKVAEATTAEEQAIGTTAAATATANCPLRDGWFA